MMRRPAHISVLAGKTLVAAVLLACVIADPAADPAWALSLRATPFVTLAGGWDSNITSAIDNQISDIAFQAFPGIVLTTDVLNTAVNLSGSFNMHFYGQYSELNTYERSGIFGLNTTQPIQATENLSITPEARYFKSSDVYVRNSNVVGSQNQLLSTQASPGTSRELTEFAGGISLNYHTSQIGSLYLSGIYIRDAYSTPGFINANILLGTLGYSRQISQRTMIGPSVSGNRSSFSNGEESRIYSGVLNVTFTVSSFTSILASGGVSRWYTEHDPSAPGSRDGWDPYGSLNYRYDRETWHVTAGTAYQTQSSGGPQAVVRSISANLSVLKNFTPLWSFNIVSSYNKNISVNAAGNLNYYWFNQAILRYQMFENIGFTLTGTEMYSDYRQSGGSGVTYDRTNVFLGVDARKEYTIF